MADANPANAAPAVEKKVYTQKLSTLAATDIENQKSLRNWSDMQRYEVILKAHHQALGNKAGDPIDWTRPEMRVKDRTPSACKHEYNERVKMHMDMVMRGVKVTGFFKHSVTHAKRAKKDVPSGTKRKADEIDEDGDGKMSFLLR